MVVASREAAKSIFLIYSFSLYRNDVENAGKKDNLENVKKNVSIRHLYAHPAGGQETKLFLRVA